MSVADVLNSRVSTRGFLDTPIPEEKLKEILLVAQQSPSNCNTQPWQTYVVSGTKKDELSAKLVEAVISGSAANPDFDWKVGYEGKHKDRQFGSAFALYDALGIKREDRQARAEAMLRNWQFFGAPHAVFFTMEKYLDIMGAVDIGIYAQSIALLLEENGMGCCMQGALGQFPDPVREYLGLPESVGVLFGMSIGYPDTEAKANKARTERVDLDSAVTLIS